MKKWVTKHIRLTIVLVVLLLSCGTHFAYYSQQKESVFDEVYFGTFAQDYYQHTYYFDIHPPLGKLLIAASALPQGIPTDAKFVNEAYQGTQPNFARLRLLPTIAGTLLPVVITLLVFELRFSKTDDVCCRLGFGKSFAEQWFFQSGFSFSAQADDPCWA
jgi:dolichyl-phosphate-mannose-protein mannosyltransferase